MPQKRMEGFRLLFDHPAWIEHQFLSGIRDSRKTGSLWGMMRGVGGVRKSIHQGWLTKGLGLGLLCWGFKGVQKRCLGKRPALFKLGQGHFQQDNAPVHNSILVTDYLTKMGINAVLWRGLEFHVCTINKSAHTKKSLETYLIILLYIYIYIYIISRKNKVGHITIINWAYTLSPLPGIFRYSNFE